MQLSDRFLERIAGGQIEICIGNELFRGKIKAAVVIGSSSKNGNTKWVHFIPLWIASKSGQRWVAGVPHPNNILAQLDAFRQVSEAEDKNFKFVVDEATITLFLPDSDGLLDPSKVEGLTEEEKG